MKSTLTIFWEELAAELLAPDGIVIVEHRSGSRAAQRQRPSRNLRSLHRRRIAKPGRRCVELLQLSRGKVAAAAVFARL